MAFTSEESTQDDAHIDTAIAVGEKLAALEQAFDDLRQALARHCGGALYIYPGTAARVAVEAERRRAARRRAA